MALIYLCSVSTGSGLVGLYGDETGDVVATAPGVLILPARARGLQVVRLRIEEARRLGWRYRLFEPIDDQGPSLTPPDLSPMTATLRVYEVSLREWRHGQNPAFVAFLGYCASLLTWVVAARGTDIRPDPKDYDSEADTDDDWERGVQEMINLVRARHG